MSEINSADEVAVFAEAFMREAAYIPYADQPMPSRADRLALTFFKKAWHGGVHHQNEVMRRLERLPLGEIAHRFTRWAVEEKRADILRVGLSIAGLIAGRDHRGSGVLFKAYAASAPAVGLSAERLFVEVACQLVPSAGEAMRAFLYNDGQPVPVEELIVSPPEDGQTYPVSEDPDMNSEAG